MFINCTSKYMETLHNMSKIRNYRKARSPKTHRKAFLAFAHLLFLKNNSFSKPASPNFKPLSSHVQFFALSA